MTVRLPDELRSALTARGGEPLELTDDQTQRAYVLLPADEFERLKTAAETDLAETYAAQVASALEAGWNAPGMDEYDDYDAHRKEQ